MAKRAVFCIRHNHPDLRAATYKGLDPRVVAELAKLRFCPYCGVWVPTRNAAAIGMTGLPVAFTPDPDSHPEASILCQLVRVGVNSDGLATGRLVASDGTGRVFDDGEALGARVRLGGGHTRSVPLVGGVGSSPLSAAR